MEVGNLIVNGETRNYRICLFVCVTSTNSFSSFVGVRIFAGQNTLDWKIVQLHFYTGEGAER